MVIKGIPYRGIYREAFWEGFSYAYDGESWAFGEHSAKEDLEHIPFKAKNKELWLEAWHEGCGIGVEN